MTSDWVLKRELSWLEFNRRMLQAAQDPAAPLLERVKPLATFREGIRALVPRYQRWVPS